MNSLDLFNSFVIEAQYKAPETCILHGIDVSLISYADNILNICRTLQGLKSCFSALTDEYSRIGHSFNPTKTELLFFNYNLPTDDVCVILEGPEVKPVQAVTYLGV